MTIYSISSILSKFENNSIDDPSNDSVNKKEYQRFFRGHGNYKYKFLPSLLRDKNLIENEHNMINEILIECSNDFKDCLSNSEKLVKMQHYGLSTRLMDITSNPLVALYFACSNPMEKDYDGCLIQFDVHKSQIKTFDSDAVSILSALSKLDIISKNALKEKVANFISIHSIIGPSEIKLFNDISDPENKTIAWLLHEIKKEKPAFENVINPTDLLDSCLFRPQKLNDRIIRQNGSFILFGLDYNPEARNPPTLSFNFGSLDINKNQPEGLLISSYSIIRISKYQKDAILTELNTFGINEAYIYPELYKVTDYINQKYKR